MNELRRIKAINIVFISWIVPSNKIKFKALQKIQRFCRRASGQHAYPHMIKQLNNYFPYGPPVLYRQVANCVVCATIPIRIKNQSKTSFYCYYLEHAQYLF